MCQAPHLHCEGELVVVCPQEVGHLAGCLQPKCDIQPCPWFYVGASAQLLYGLPPASFWSKTSDGHLLSSDTCSQHRLCHLLEFTLSMMYVQGHTTAAMLSFLLLQAASLPQQPLNGTWHHTRPRTHRQVR
jgi:hypothetical protein